MFGRTLVALVAAGVLLLSASQAPAAEYTVDARRLYDELLYRRAYNRFVRPAPTPNVSVELFLGVSLTALMELVRRLSPQASSRPPGRTAPAHPHPSGRERPDGLHATETEARYIRAE